jgi:hypothetical protein
MTTGERAQAIADYGFTERQARFLVLVMQHSGLCVKRHYAAFAGIKPGGEKCNAFFEKLVRRGYAVASDCIHNRARLYHIHHKPLYHAIGEPESRYRRPVPARRAAERLMRVDSALVSPDLEWLTTRTQKLAHLAARTASDPSEPPVEVAVQDRTDLFPGTFPIGIDAAGRALLVYITTVPWTDDFRTFLVGHLDLLTVLPKWTVRVVFPLSLQRVVPDYAGVVHDELESRLDAQTINHLQWYFFHCRRRTDWSATGGIETLKARFDRCKKAFAGPRFTRLYRRWLTEGDAAFAPVPPGVAEAFTSGRAGLECIVLPHGYEHLSPLISHRRSRRRRVTVDAREGAEDRRSLNPALNLVS